MPYICIWKSSFKHLQMSHSPAILTYLFFAAAAIPASSQNLTDSISGNHELSVVVVKPQAKSKALSAVTNTEIIGQSQLIRAACCNIGESFTTNPSVDVNYNDAATGSRQIKLLGLSGIYVQMLTENMPNLRGASIPYSLGFVPGPWMQSIQVSKGASSVKNGYESITGQINIEYLKPQGVDGIRANAYLDSRLRHEANAHGSIHLTDRLSASLLLHFENRQTDHDGNGDGFMDMPKMRQYNAMQRWAYISPLWISQLSYRILHDERESGMSHHHAESSIPHYTIGVETKRHELQWKNGYTICPDRKMSVALMLHGSLHDAQQQFGHTLYDVNQKNAYAQLMFETDLGEAHQLSVGASVNHDRFRENTNESFPSADATALLAPPNETTAGIYAQYTYRLVERLTLMPGIRWDHSSLYGGFVTPRLHLKYTPLKILSIRASAGKGYRTPHALAENVPLLASGRTFTAGHPLKQEEAWNFGASAMLHLPVAGKDLELNVEYYYTDFRNQTVINVDATPGTHTVSFENLHGKSFSHTVQIDATYPFFEGFSATGGFRYNDARTTYDGTLRQRPLTSRYKGLLTLSYKTPTELWQLDVTGQLNGHGILYDRSSYPTFFQLQAQITREFRHFSVYIGGENLTNYRMKHPIINAANPWEAAYDATQVWGPTEKAMVYIGCRLKFEKL